MVVQYGDQLLDGQQQKCQGGNGQAQVVDLEQEVQLERRHVQGVEHKAAAEDHQVVHSNDSDRLPPVRQKRLIVDELELLGRITHHLLESGGEEWPQMEAKGALDCRKSKIKQRLLVKQVENLGHGVLRLVPYRRVLLLYGIFDVEDAVLHMQHRKLGMQLGASDPNKKGPF